MHSLGYGWPRLGTALANLRATGEVIGNDRPPVSPADSDGSNIERDKNREDTVVAHYGAGSREIAVAVSRLLVFKAIHRPHSRIVGISVAR